MRPALAASAAFGLIAFIAGGAAAAPRPARCVIASAGATTWRGPCLFHPERDGSFAVTPRRGASFADGITTISVFITSPGAADVRGLTRQGINSRWGEARRSGRDRACWVGEDFSICVY